jgi:hypothetical protein
MLFIF